MSRLYRSQRDKKVFGLCGGLAESFNVDVTLLRLIVVITAFFSAGTVVFLYIIASLVIPKEPGFEKTDNPFAGSFHAYHEPTRPHYSNHGDYREPRTEKKDNIDHMMEDIEKKALWKEIEELKAKLKKYEDEKKGDQ